MRSGIQGCEEGMRDGTQAAADWMEGEEEGGVERGDDALKSMFLEEEHPRSRIGVGKARRRGLGFGGPWSFAVRRWVTEEAALLPAATVGLLGPLPLCSHEILCSFSVPASCLRMLLDQTSTPENLQEVLSAPHPQVQHIHS